MALFVVIVAVKQHLHAVIAIATSASHVSPLS